MRPAGPPDLATAVSAQVAAIDWQRPWLAPWRDDAPRILAWLQAGASVADALNALNAEPSAAGLGAPLRFVPQSALPDGQAYEQFIFETGQCPTRENLHDLFNGLCWWRFPAIKRRLNHLQADQIAASGVQPLRGPVRDALTVFDENAALLEAPQPLWDALLAHDWRKLFMELRPLWQQARLVPFGHALLEKLVHPRKAITAHVYLFQPVPGERLDEGVAGSLDAARLALKPFAPLPVLGIPGWWPENENFSFYDDSDVFRPARARQPGGRARGAA